MTCSSIAKHGSPHADTTANRRVKQPPKSASDVFVTDNTFTAVIASFVYTS